MIKLSLNLFVMQTGAAKARVDLRLSDLRRTGIPKGLKQKW